MSETIHFYRSGSKRMKKFKMICDPREWVHHDQSWREPKKFTTSLRETTCPDCLAVLLAEMEEELKRQKRRYNELRHNTEGTRTTS